MDADLDLLLIAVYCVVRYFHEQHVSYARTT
jgi:hypothetical protein